MKRLILPILAIQLAFFSTAQTDMNDVNKWSVGINVGGHDGMAPTYEFTRLYQITHYGANVRYMFNNRVGLMLDGGYDFFNFKDFPGNTHYVRTSLQGVVNAGDILRFDTWTKRLGLLVHGGAGMSNMWQKGQLDNTPLFDKSDDMISFIFGATPQFKVNERFAINADLSFIFHAGQDHTYDFRHANTRNGIDGYMLNLSVGAVFYLGKHARHADWTPTVYGSDKTLEKRVSELEERTRDTDADGVPDYLDKEPGTPEGTYVNSHGEAISDKDGDGIVDAYDQCPEEKGSFATNGCPDSDNDGVEDVNDKCPNTPGVRANKGCPELSVESRGVMDRALNTIMFEFGKADLLASSYPALNEVVELMKAHPEYRIDIEGYADSIGTKEFNLDLSQRRAARVSEYLVAQGISSGRIDTRAYGETHPIAPNSTEEGRAANRRVELKIVF